MRSQLNWDARYLKIAFEISKWSKDPSTKVGAVLVDHLNNSIVSTGFNGFPLNHSDSHEAYHDRDYKYANIIHAESNALRQCSISHRKLTMYCTFPSCDNCMHEMISRGVSRVVLPYNYKTQYFGKTKELISYWEDRILISTNMAILSDVQVCYIPM